MIKKYAERLYQLISTGISALIYLPNVTLFRQLFSSEIFPWAFLFSIRKNMRLPIGYLIFLGYMLLSAIFILSKGAAILVPARALFALLNATLIFFIIIRIDDKELEVLKKVFVWVFGINIGLSIIQYFGMFPSILTPFVRLFIDRFTDQPYGAGRGVAALFAEPSYASLAIHYFFAYAMFMYRIHLRSMLGYVAILAMILFDLFIIRSITGLVMIFVYFISLQRWKQLWRGAILFICSGLVVLYFANQAKEKPRAVEFMYDLIYNQEYQDPMPFLLNESGFRVISVAAAYNYGFFHPLGSGIGGWSSASLEAMDDIGVPASEISFFSTFAGGEFEGVRPTSFISDIFLELGWVGFVLFILAFATYIFNKKLYNDQTARPIVVMFLFNLFVMGTIGDPLPFIFLALVYRTHHEPELNVIVQ